MKIPRASIHAIVLLPFAAAAAFSYFRVAAILRDTAVGRRRAMAVLAASVLEEKFERLEDIGTSLATRARFVEFVDQGRWDDAIGDLRTVPSVFPFIDRVFLADAAGTLRAHEPALPGVVGKNFAYREWYRSVRATGKPSISEVYRRMAPPQYDVVALSVPVRGASGALRGIMVLQVRASTVLDWIAALSPDAGVSVEVMDQKGRLVAGADPADAAAPAAASVRASSSAAVPRYGWTVVAHTAEYHALRRRALGVLLGVDAIILLLALALARVLARTLDALEAREAELARARDEAVEAARFKSEFVANVSHEIRTPMNAIIGITDLLLNSSVSGPQREDLQALHSAGGILLALTNDILDLSKLESGKMSLESVRFDPRLAMEEVVALLEPAARGKGLRLDFTAADDVPPELQGDPTRLKQILTNLVANGVKFTERGAVRLRAELESSADDGEWVRFEVRDTGIGVTAEQRERLFQAFVQGDAGTNRKYGGTGLGLAISKMLAETMGGQIGMDSIEGGGSSFWLRLKCPPRAARVS